MARDFAMKDIMLDGMARELTVKKNVTWCVRRNPNVLMLHFLATEQILGQNLDQTPALDIKEHHATYFVIILSTAINLFLTTPKHLKRQPEQ